MSEFTTEYLQSIVFERKKVDIEHIVSSISSESGLSDEQVLSSRESHGSNYKKPPKFISIVISNAKSNLTILNILLAFACNIQNGQFIGNYFYLSFTIISTLIFQSALTHFFYQKRNTKQISVIRKQKVNIQFQDLVVGDIIQCYPSTPLPDSVLISDSLLTVQKFCAQKKQIKNVEFPFILNGSVSRGSGRVIVTAVGENSFQERKGRNFGTGVLGAMAFWAMVLVQRK
ncbi:Plasma_membrane calcium-transporting ATPase [Hexamita inflata]|uniref:Plasma_membrane calcium-transporting ATPase n=1 Tax=Hexamita inflata TaxID=28002 RepID=A0ABP1KHJ3_9EUKA